MALNGLFCADVLLRNYSLSFVISIIIISGILAWPIR